MNDEQVTLSIIKPDAVAMNYIGDIINRFEKARLKVVGAKMLHLSQQKAEGFYAIHKSRPFFQNLVKFMVSGPILVLALSGKDAVKKNRELMGATNPLDAFAGTIRHDLAKNIDANSVHGSDSVENAKIEIDFFFTSEELFA